jgi:hypothetical protein
MFPELLAVVLATAQTLFAWLDYRRKKKQDKD